MTRLTIRCGDRTHDVDDHRYGPVVATILAAPLTEVAPHDTPVPYILTDTAHEELHR